VTEYRIVQEKSPSFYESFFRRDELQHQTHYCPGCGHGVIHKLIAEAIDQLGVQDRAILISPVGCSVFAYYYFDVGNVQAAHGRAPAVATGVKRAQPDSIVVSYQGDGDLAAIGTAEIIHAANRGELITVFFVNNAIYGMTGGQMAPTTLIGQKSTTSPFGRRAENEGFPIRVCELLASLEAPVYIERVATHDNKSIMKARKAIRKALEVQVQGRGFSLVELLSPCPTIWNMTPREARKWIEEKMLPVFPLGVYRDKTAEKVVARAPGKVPKDAEILAILELEHHEATATAPDVVPHANPGDRHFRHAGIRIVGFGGQGVLLLGQVIAEAGMEEGLHVSWLPSYGPEMRGGTANCHVRLSVEPIASPLVSRPEVLIALNEPALHKFSPEVVPGGLILYNGHVLPADFHAEGVDILVMPATEMADKLGSTRAANMVMLGALLERTGSIRAETVFSTLTQMIRNEKLLDIDRRAITAGMDFARQKQADPAQTVPGQGATHEITR
jgi:2-oxoisovalerate ferredoxin oxidoreductase beta subunit